MWVKTNICVGPKNLNFYINIYVLNTFNQFQILLYVLRKCLL